MKTWKTISAVVAVLAITGLSYLSFSSAEEGKSIEQMIAEAFGQPKHEMFPSRYTHTYMLKRTTPDRSERRNRHTNTPRLLHAPPCLKGGT